MTSVDVIIIARSHSEQLRRMTQTAIDTAIKSPCKVYVVEQTKVDHKNCQTLHYNFPFNYNACLEYGYQHTTGDVIVFANNDLIFNTDWIRGILKGLKNYESVCPINPYIKQHKTREGFQIGITFNGWCYAMKREHVEEMLPFPKEVIFWWSDNLWTEKMQSKGWRNLLTKESIVWHLESKTFKTMPKVYQNKLIEKIHAKAR